MPRRSLRLLALVFLLLLVAAAPLAAQEARGTILGRVTDPQGGVVPGASVIITNVETNSVNRTATNETGYYEVPLLIAGRYTIAPKQRASSAQCGGRWS